MFPGGRGGRRVEIVAAERLLSMDKGVFFWPLAMNVHELRAKIPVVRFSVIQVYLLRGSPIRLLRLPLSCPSRPSETMLHVDSLAYEETWGVNGGLCGDMGPNSRRRRASEPRESFIALEWSAAIWNTVFTNWITFLLLGP